MNCLKCGAQTEKSRVFCNHCLELMATRPVKQGTPLHFPTRETQTIPKSTHRKRKILDLEERISRLRKLLICFAAAIVALAIALGITLNILSLTKVKLENALVTGKNYMVETTPVE